MSTTFTVQSITEISQTANKFTSSIVITVGNSHIDAKSILGLFVTITPNKNYDIEVIGHDSAEAKEAMKKVFEKNGLKANLV
jgi:phosphocarrier protein HPr